MNNARMAVAVLTAGLLFHSQSISQAEDDAGALAAGIGADAMSFEFHFAGDAIAGGKTEAGSFHDRFV